MRIGSEYISDEDNFSIPIDLMESRELSHFIGSFARPQNIISPYIDLRLQLPRTGKLIEKSTPSIFEQIENELELLSVYYEYRKKREIVNFLINRQSILNLIREAPLQIQKHFGSDMKLAIEIIYDPEIEDFKILFIYIKTNLDVDEALKRLDKIDEEWHYEEIILNEDPNVVSEFEINLEFVK